MCSLVSKLTCELSGRFIYHCATKTTEWVETKVDEQDGPLCKYIHANDQNSSCFSKETVGKPLCT